MVDLADIRSRTVSAIEYMDSLEGKEADLFHEFYEEYKPDMNVVSELRDYIEGLTVVALSAIWCKDCRFAVPILKHLQEKIGLDVRMFGKIKTDPLNPDRKWAVPPSPPEANEWGVKAIPWIVIFDRDGNEIGVIIEKQEITSSLEAEILHILKNK